MRVAAFVKQRSSQPLRSAGNQQLALRYQQSAFSYQLSEIGGSHHLILPME